MSDINVNELAETINNKADRNLQNTSDNIDYVVERLSKADVVHPVEWDLQLSRCQKKWQIPITYYSTVTTDLQPPETNVMRILSAPPNRSR